MANVFQYPRGIKPLTPSRHQQASLQTSDPDPRQADKSDHNHKVLRRVQKWAQRWECSMKLGKFRFGWGCAIGLVPVIGDLCNLVFAIFIMRECRKVDNGLSLKSYVWMALNIASSFLIDLLPIIGDIVDAVFKFNTRNVKILERLLEDRRKKANEEAWAVQFEAGEKEKVSNM